MTKLASQYLLSTSEVVMYLIARADLQMSPGKLGAQVGHGVQYALDLAVDSAALRLWKQKSSTKIVLKVDSEEELLALYEKIGAEICALVIDEGRTEIAPGPTVIGMVPMDKKAAYPYVGHLKRYR